MHWLIHGQIKTICLPAVHPPRENTPQDRTGGSKGSCTHCTSMGKSVEVFPTARESGRFPNHSPRTPALLHNPMGEPHPTVIRNHLRKTGCLESVWGQVKDRGFFGGSSSWRHGTEKSYSSYGLTIYLVDNLTFEKLLPSTGLRIVESFKG